MGSIGKLDSSPSTVGIPSDPVPDDKVASTKTAAVSQAKVSEFKDNDVNAGVAGRFLEQAMRGSLEALPPGGSIKFSADGYYGIGGAGGGVTVKKRDDGKFEATFDGELRVQKLFKKQGVGSVRGGAKAGGGITMKFDTAEEAADRMAAFAQLGAMSLPTVPGGNLAAMALSDDDVHARAAAALRKKTRFEVQYGAGVETALEAKRLKVGLKGGAETRVRVDLEKGSVTFDQALKAEGNLGISAAGKFEFGKDVSPIRVSGAAKGLGAAKFGAIFRQEVALSPAELERVKSGDTGFLEELVNKEGTASVIGTAEFQIGGRKVHRERTFSLGGSVGGASGNGQDVYFVAAGQADVGVEFGNSFVGIDLKAKVELAGKQVYRGAALDMDGEALASLIAGVDTQDGSDEDAMQVLRMAARDL